MLTKLLTFALLVFALGWLSHASYADIALATSTSTDIVPEVKAAPEPEQVILQAKKTDNKPVQQPNAQDEREREWVKLPDFLSPEDIHVTGNRVVIDGIPGYEYETAIFTNTDSMLPLLDENSQAIQIKPKSEKDIKVGMTISYDPPDHLAPPGTFIHAVQETGYDSQGWYAIVQGYNNPYPDPVKVRFNMIKRILVGVLY